MLEGKVSDFSLPEIFQLIALTKKSGTLNIVTRDQHSRVRFRDGEVCEAAADVSTQALGTRLVAAGLVEETHLAAALQAKREQGGEVLALLLEHASIDEGALHAFVREQIADAVAEMLRLEDASFRFDAEEMAGDTLIDVQVATDQLVTEGHQRLAEWDAIREHVPGDDTVFALSPQLDATDGVALDAASWQVLALVDGRRPVSEIVTLAGRGDFATNRVLADLAGRGVLARCDGDGDGPLAPLLERRDMLRKLEELELRDQPAPETLPLEPAGPGGGKDAAPAPAKPAPAKPEPASPKPAPAPAKAEDPAPEKREPEKPAPAKAPEPAKAKDTIPPAPAPKPADGKLPEPKTPEPPPKPSPQPPKPSTEVDRAQVARELASLGLDDDPKPTASQQGTNGAARPHSGSAESNGEASSTRRLVRDEELNRGILLRLIDGVKGA